MKRWTVLSFALLFLLSACGPSEAEMQATTTQVAAEMFGTQTALVPTATPTITPTPTETFTPIPTTTFTSTPHPPTATLTAAGVEKLMLCYKVAVSIEADWEVHLLISGTGNLFDGWYNPDNQWKSQDEISQELNAFWWERSHRVGGFKIERVDKLVNPLSSTTITVDGVVLSENEFGRPDCDHYFNEIIIADAKIQINPKGGVMNRISEVSYAKKIINKVVKKMRTELIEVYGVDPAELDAIEDPIWQFMRNLYGEPLNKIPIMRKRTEP